MIKVIDLLNMISRHDSDLPLKLKYDDNIYCFDKSTGDYRKNGCEELLLVRDIFGDFNCLGKHNSLYNMLNDKVKVGESNV